jgi:hypothetical protein
VVTEDTVAVNPALVAFAATVSVGGTVTAELLLDRFTASPPLGAAAVSVTVQASVPDPVMDPLLQESPLRVLGAAVPVPLKPITAVAPDEELLVTVNCPFATPVEVGLKVTFRVRAWPGFKVTGNVAPETANPAPVAVAELILSGAVPVEVKVTV